MAINLATKYSDKLAAFFTKESFLAGKAGNDYEFTGVNGIKIYNIITQSLNDYSRTATSNRYGTPSELQDAVQEATLSQDKSFSIVIDKGNNTEQHAIKEAGRVMQMQIKEQVVPFMDKHALKMWARNAGQTLTASNAPTAQTIIGYLVNIETAFEDKLVPQENRYVAMSNANVGLVRQSLTSCDNITDKLLLKGLVGQFGTLKIVGVPSAWLPLDTYMVAWQSSAVLEPQTIKDAKLHIDPPGFSGHLLEGRYRFDAFVVGAKCDAVIVLVPSTYKTATPTATKGSTTTSLASTTNSGTVTIKYTLDGTDPRYSASAVEYSQAFTNPEADTILKAVAFYDDDSTPHYYYNSDVLTHVCV